MNESLKEAIAETQAEVFTMSRKYNLDSETFIRVFMKSPVARDLDSTFNFMQWAGRAYIMERILDELKYKLKFGGEIYDEETLYWTGYVYRMWHFYTNETSKEIYKQANAKTMRATYLPYHTMSVEMAIDRLKETYIEKHKK